VYLVWRNERCLPIQVAGRYWVENKNEKLITAGMYKTNNKKNVQLCRKISPITGYWVENKMVFISLLPKRLKKLYSFLWSQRGSLPKIPKLLKLKSLKKWAVFTDSCGWSILGGGLRLCHLLVYYSQDQDGEIAQGSGWFPLSENSYTETFSPQTSSQWV